MSFIVLAALYPAWDAAHQAGLQGAVRVCEPFALPISILCLSRRNLLLWVQSGSMTTGGETSPHVEHPQSSERWVCVGIGFWRLGSLLADTILLPRFQYLSQGMQHLSELISVCFALTGVSCWDEGHESQVSALLRCFLDSHEPTSHCSACISMTCTCVAALSHLAEVPKVLKSSDFHVLAGSSKL